MPPKKSELVHVTFHFHRSIVVLSVPGSTTVSQLKTALIPALKPFQASNSPLPVPIPSSSADIQLYAEKLAVEGAEDMPTALRVLDDDKKTLMGLELNRWPKVYVSFRGAKGFSEPEYTIPRVDDEVADAE